MELTSHVNRNLRGALILTEAEVRQRLRNVLATGVARQTWCERHGFSETFVSMVLNGQRAPSARMCEALGVRKRAAEVGYEETEAGGEAK